MTKVQLLTSDQVCKRLGISTARLYQLMAARRLVPREKLPGVTGKNFFHPEDVERYHFERTNNFRVLPLENRRNEDRRMGEHKAELKELDELGEKEKARFEKQCASFREMLAAEDETRFRTRERKRKAS